MRQKTPITIAFGDGIGPEIMRATLTILDAAGAQLAPEIIEIGEKVYKQGNTSGIPADAWEAIKRTKVLLKSPITTPQGGGYKSLNVTLRKTLGLFANIRPCVSYAPYIATKFPHINLVIVRENEEDTYAGIEYRETDEVYQCLKLLTRPGCEQIIHYAFAYAQKYNRKKVSCLSKDNIMKMTDGLFHRCFEQIAQAYPTIQHDHLIIDIGTALIATQPERFDVIVTLNLYGDIISDVAAQVAGSVGLAGSANIGKQMAMFEAIHGSAPDIAGKNIANPSGLLHAAIQMLVHIEQIEVANTIENAWLKTIEDGIHTGDIASSQYTRQKVGTQEFAQAVIARLGKQPDHLRAANYTLSKKTEFASVTPVSKSEKKLVGVDVFIDNAEELPADVIAAKLKGISAHLNLITITSRGLKIWPQSSVASPFLRQCCCRFQSANQDGKLTAIDYAHVLQLLEKINASQIHITQAINLYTFNDERGFSLAQGE